MKILQIQENSGGDGITTLRLLAKEINLKLPPLPSAAAREAEQEAIKIINGKTHTQISVASSRCTRAARAINQMMKGELMTPSYFRSNNTRCASFMENISKMQGEAKWNAAFTQGTARLLKYVDDLISQLLYSEESRSGSGSGSFDEYQLTIIRASLLKLGVLLPDRRPARQVTT